MERRTSLVHRYLDPATSLAEILFGLIMTLTFTLGAGIIIDDEGREGARELLIAVIGCNIAWGVIDGALYLVNEWFDRGRLRRLGLAIREAPDAGAAKIAGGGRTGRSARGRDQRFGAREPVCANCRQRALEAREGRSPSARPTSWEPSPASGWS